MNFLANNWMYFAIFSAAAFVFMILNMLLSFFSISKANDSDAFDSRVKTGFGLHFVFVMIFGLSLPPAILSVILATINYYSQK